MALSSGWTLGRIFPLKGWLSIGMDCPGRLWSHHAWKCSGNDWTWHCLMDMLWFNWYGRIQSKAGENDLFQSS